MSPAATRAMPWIAAAAALLALGGGLYGCSKKGEGDRLSDAQAEAAQGAAENLSGNAVERAAALDPATRCASSATYALLKRELFRRATQIRGKDDAMLARVASAAALRVEQPVVRSRDEGLGSIACAASAALDLPPSLAVADGRTSVTADVDYTLQPAADGSGDVLTLTHADAITVPLATVGRHAAFAEPVPIPGDALTPRPAIPPPPPPSLPTVVRGAPPKTPADPLAPRPTASPSFDCTRARTRGEQMICADAGLAALDRRMAAQYRSAVNAADDEQRDQLRSTGRRFAGFRDNCPTARCIADGTRERMREIDAIMAGDQR